MAMIITQEKALPILSPIFLVLSVAFFLGGRGIEPTDSKCVQSMSSWSPALDQVRYHWETFQNGFSQKSIYRGRPTADLERAWTDSLQKHPIVVPRDKVAAQCGQDEKCIAKGKDDGAPAYLEVFRNLACLNLLRQHTYRGEYDYSSLRSFQGSEEQIMTRVDSCVQRLRGVLMCAGDATPYLIMLTPEKKQKESPDFNTLHYCRDFDRILDWTKRNEDEGLAVEHFGLYE
ncbi:FluG domain-containing protein [Purpureocillium lavendulum]|uniref:FluG domain-containing protein n=1 Tax=Purpureocillium lavendulum TaxID=1247861 RepID=A0AB34FDC7_9HYPO|nr:FluG domain-containing protein [Purpureocillium lavendulum]